jgi:DNA adenine methylase
MKSPLKWAGGKSKLASIIKPLYDKHRDKTWLDLFAGSCALPLILQPESVVINDVNSDLIEFWRWIASDGTIEDSLVNDPFIYYAVRSRFNKHRKPQDFYYLNQTGYNGLCRYSKSNKFNVPYGGYYKEQLREIDYQHDFTKWQEAIQDWIILNYDYKALLNFEFKRNCYFIYADPPYDDGFTKYSKDSFTWSSQVKLANMLAESNTPVVASNKATARILELYEGLGFNVEIIKVGRSISCNGDRQPVDEMLATKNIM